MFHDFSFLTLRDTDAAGVTFFAAYFTLAHQTYERYLYQKQLGLQHWLNRVHLPIVHSDASYKAPLFLGDPVCISMGTTKLGKRSFRLHYRFHAWQNEKWVWVADVSTTHVAVENKKARELPTQLHQILEELGEFNEQFELPSPLTMTSSE